jgi:hypothetical protein
VWRKSAEHTLEGSTASTTSSIAAGRVSTPPSTIARAAARPDGGPSESTSPMTPSPEPIAAGRRALDTSLLTDQVTRRLLRQIAIERERRGAGTRWP